MENQLRLVRRVGALVAATSLLASGGYVVGCTKGKIPESAEVVLEAASSPGDSPWMESISSPAAPTTLPSTKTLFTAVQAADGGQQSVSGEQTGLYGGTPDSPVCNPGKMVRFLADHPEKAKAFEQVAHTDDIPKYFLALSPVVTTTDVRVTNHGYDNGLTTFQSVMQKGTTVLVDNVGVPRVRCACGNPLSEPMAPAAAIKQNYVGEPWNDFNVKKAVVVNPAPAPVKQFVLTNVSNGPADPNAPPPPALAIAPGETVPTAAPASLTQTTTSISTGSSSVTSTSTSTSTSTNSLATTSPSSATSSSTATTSTTGTTSSGAATASTTGSSTSVTAPASQAVAPGSGAATGQSVESPLPNSPAATGGSTTYERPVENPPIEHSTVLPHP